MLAELPVRVCRTLSILDYGDVPRPGCESAEVLGSAMIKILHKGCRATAISLMLATAQIGVASASCMEMPAWPKQHGRVRWNLSIRLSAPADVTASQIDSFVKSMLVTRLIGYVGVCGMMIVPNDLVGSSKMPKWGCNDYVRIGQRVPISVEGGPYLISPVQAIRIRDKVCEYAPRNSKIVGVNYMTADIRPPVVGF